MPRIWAARDRTPPVCRSTSSMWRRSISSSGGMEASGASLDLYCFSGRCRGAIGWLPALTAAGVSDFRGNVRLGATDEQALDELSRYVEAFRAATA